MSEKWAIIGSFGQVLQGINLIPNDIDLITTRKGAYEIQSIFEKDIYKSVNFSSSSFMRSFFGIMNINGYKVEFFGDIENLIQENIWEPHLNWEKNIKVLTFDTFSIPVISLEYELLICKKLQKKERAILIEKKLLRNGKL